MGMSKYDLHDVMELRRTFLVYDDFTEYSSGASNGSGWTSVTGGSATVNVADGVGGILTLSCIDSTLNRECYVKGSHQCYKFVNNQPFCGEWFIQYSEANTNKANIAVGFMSSVGAASMQDTTGEPKTNFSGAVIYKVPGGTQWKTCSSVGTTQNVSQSDTTAGGSSYTRLRIEVMPVSSTLAEITYYVDGVQLKTSGGRPGQSLIKDQLTYTGAVVMAPFACCKNGSTTPETLNIDYIGCEYLRALFTGF